MRNLVLFIWKNNFFFLFLVMEVIAYWMVVQNNRFHKAHFINSSNEISGNAYQTISNISEYFSLKETNERLAIENAALRGELRNSKTNYTVVSKQFTDSIYKQQYTYVEAKVVNNSVHRQKNYITINRGSAQGITNEMGVIFNGCVAGIIRDVSPNFSSAMSLLNRDSRVSSKLKRDGSFGPLTWDGDDYRYGVLSDIPTHVKIAKGDTVVTSAYSTIFPEGLLVGYVEAFEIPSGANFYTVKIRLACDFTKINHVYIVGNLLKLEQEELENKTANEK